MERILGNDPPLRRVTAVFEGGAFCFEMSAGATLEELARRLGRAGEQHDEALIAVQVARNRAWTHEPAATAR